MAKRNVRFIAWSEIATIVFIVALLVAVVAIVINPFEVQEKRRDTIRKQDLANMESAIERMIVSSFSGTSAAVFRADFGSSLEEDSSRGDGSGWVKVDISAYFSTLPLDPLNDGIYVYEFGHANGRYELRARLESGERISTDGRNDGGDDSEWFEVGTLLTIL